MPGYDLVVDILTIVFACSFLIFILFAFVYAFLYMVKAERMKSEYIKKLKEDHKDELVAAICFYNHCRPSFSECFKKGGKNE